MALHQVRMAWSCHYQPRSDSDVGSSKAFHNMWRVHSAYATKSFRGWRCARSLLVIYPRFLFRQAGGSGLPNKESRIRQLYAEGKVDKWRCCWSRKPPLTIRQAAWPCGTASTNQMVVEFVRNAVAGFFVCASDCAAARALTAAAASGNTSYRQRQYVDAAR